MRKLNVKPNTKAAKIVAPVAKPAGKPSTAPLGTAAAAQAPRSNVAPAVKPSTVSTLTPAPTVAKPAAGIARTIRTIAARNTNFGGLSDRDEAYFSFYKRLAAKHGGSVTVAQIHASGEKPNYTGSAKPHDAGVIVRLCKAGLIAEAGGSVSLTKLGTEHKAS